MTILSRKMKLVHIVAPTADTLRTWGVKWHPCRVQSSKAGAQRTAPDSVTNLPSLGEANAAHQEEGHLAICGEVMWFFEICGYDSMPRRSILLISSWMERCSFQFWSFFPTAIALRVFRHSKAFGSLWQIASISGFVMFCGGFPQLPTLYTSLHLSPSPLRSKKFRRKVPSTLFLICLPDSRTV